MVQRIKSKGCRQCRRLNRTNQTSWLHSSPTFIFRYIVHSIFVRLTISDLYLPCRELPCAKIKLPWVSRD